MKQLHIVHDISASSGGLALAALRYSQALAIAGSEVTLFVAERRDDELDCSETSGRFRVIWSETPMCRFVFCRVLAQMSAIRKSLIDGAFDIVHLHGTWSPVLAAASHIALTRGVPFVVSPHGCLEPWALAHKKLKKKFALALYQKRVLAGASLLIATAKQELESIRSMGLHNPVAVVPLGVDSISCRHRNLGSHREILFLSRIHPKKGIADLVEAWSMVRKPGWRVIVAGPSEGGYEATVRELVRKHCVEDDFEFPGLVLGEIKEQYFSQADLFVLPTYSENFGIAIAEALARGVPVITTTGTPWEELNSRRCGWWVEPGVKGIAKALTAAMETPRASLIEMGQRGRSLINEKYSWTRIGDIALAASEWVLSKGLAHADSVDFGSAE